MANQTGQEKMDSETSKRRTAGIATPSPSKKRKIQIDAVLSSLKQLQSNVRSDIPSSRHDGAGALIPTFKAAEPSPNKSSAPSPEIVSAKSPTKFPAKSSARLQAKASGKSPTRSPTRSPIKPSTKSPTSSTANAVSQANLAFEAFHNNPFFKPGGHPHANYGLDNSKRQPPSTARKQSEPVDLDQELAMFQRALKKRYPDNPLFNRSKHE